MLANEIYMRDPYVLVDDERYYMIGTTDQNWSCGRSGGLKIYTSEDLIHFSKPVTVFSPNADFWSEECWWAPELHKYGGKYYIFSTFFKANMGRASHILIADQITGPFRPLTKEAITPGQWDCLDATLYLEDGIPYVVYCREWTKIFNGEIYAQQLSADLKKTVSNPILLFDAESAGWTKGLNSHDPTEYKDFITDGPCLYRMKSGKLMMIWSSFSAHGYSVGMSLSDSGRIIGPWQHLDQLLYDKDGGHAMLFRDLKGQLRLSLHVNNSTAGKEYPAFFRVEESEDSLKISVE